VDRLAHHFSFNEATSIQEVLISTAETSMETAIQQFQKQMSKLVPPLNPAIINETFVKVLT
jgi:hypothetical protein